MDMRMRRRRRCSVYKYGRRVEAVAACTDGSDWLILQPIDGAAVECPRIAPQRNGIQWQTMRRDGRLFAALHARPPMLTV